MAFKFEFTGNASYPVVVAKIIKKKTKPTKQKSRGWGGGGIRVVCTACRRGYGAIGEHD